VLSGPYGAPTWTPFFDVLAEDRQVIVPSLPGYPGGGSGHETLDDHADWVCATLDLIDECAVGPVDLVGCSVGGALAAEVAAFNPGAVRRLVLIAPFGLHEPDVPVENLWARRTADIDRVLCADSVRLAAVFAVPPGVDPVEWEMERTRALTAGARLMWPLCDLGVRKRLHRISAPTLVLWGDRDAVVDHRYAERWAALIPDARAEVVAHAGHLADVDQPQAVAECVLLFLAQEAAPATRRAAS
jgi:pimeloyl-ACP methyl ester carboxylesterase